MFIGEIVTEIDRTPAPKRRLVEEGGDGYPLVHAAWLKLEYVAARLQFESGEASDDLRCTTGQFGLILGPFAAMPGDRPALVLHAYARPFGSDCVDGLA